MHVAVLKRLTEYCSFGNVLKEMLQNRFVCCISNNERIHKELQAEGNLIWPKPVELATEIEAAAKSFKKDMHIECRANQTLNKQNAKPAERDSSS